MHSRLDARVCHYTHSSIWIMRDGRLIIILIVTYNIRCIGAISFTCVCTVYTQIYFLRINYFHAPLYAIIPGGSCLAFFRVFLFYLRENRIHHLCLSKSSAWRSFATKNFVSSLTYLNLLGIGTWICKFYASTKTIHHSPMDHVWDRL